MPELEPNCDEKNELEPETKIRHLVLSGGGEIGVSFFAALEESNKAGFWKVEDIETIYATSTGALFSTLVVFTKFISWDTIRTFIIKRPWDEVFNINIDNILGSFANCGIMGSQIAVDCFRPVVRAADLSEDITMQELYETIGIEMHYMITDIDNFKLVDVSYKTHPHWKVIDAIYASCALPGAFQPINIEGTLYADGAILCNFPVMQCLQIADNPDEIFALQKTCIKSELDANTETYKQDKPNLLTYLSNILLKLLYHVSKEDLHGNCFKNLIQFPSTVTNGFHIHKAAVSVEVRTELYATGIQRWNEFSSKSTQPK
jgi:predicted acylesterase/phospholipase RssA